MFEVKLTEVCRCRKKKREKMVAEMVNDEEA